MISDIILKDINSEILPEFSFYLENLRNKEILITGGNGLIGSYIVDTLAIFNKENNANIRINIINKNETNKDSRLSHLINEPGINFIKQDVGESFKIPGKPDIIIHAASRANPSSFLADPMDTINANVKCAWNLLEYARNNPIEDFIFFSSGEIYGNPVEEFIPTPETYNGNADPLNSWSCYIESKRFVESLCMAYFRQFKIPIKIARVLLVYGPGMRDDGKVVSDFFNSSMKERAIKIKDLGLAKRSFCYISDATRQVLAILFKGKPGEVYNVGSDDKNLTIYDLAIEIARIVGKDVVVEKNINFEERKIYGVNNRLLDLNKIKSIGYIQKVSLNEGLNRLFIHYQDNKN